MCIDVKHRGSWFIDYHTPGTAGPPLNPKLSTLISVMNQWWKVFRDRRNKESCLKQSKPYRYCRKKLMNNKRVLYGELLQCWAFFFFFSASFYSEPLAEVWWGRTGSVGEAGRIKQNLVTKTGCGAGLTLHSLEGAARRRRRTKPSSTLASQLWDAASSTSA